MTPGITPQQIAKHARWRTVMTPAVLLPVFVSVAALGWGSLRMDDWWLTGAAISAGIAVAAALYRATWGRAALVERVKRQLQRGREQNHAQYLRDLRRKLRHDRDPRTGACVRRLQDIHQRHNALSDMPTTKSHEAAWYDVRHQIQELYSSCLLSLERSWDMWRNAQQVRNAELRERTLATRDAVVGEVERSIQRLEDVLDHWQSMGLADGGESNEETARLSALRTELDAGLEVARNADQRMADLSAELQDSLRPGLAE